MGTSTHLGSDPGNLGSSASQDDARKQPSPRRGWGLGGLGALSHCTSLLRRELTTQVPACAEATPILPLHQPHGTRP